MADDQVVGKREFDELVAVLKGIWRRASALDNEIMADSDRAIAILERYSVLLGEKIHQQEVALIISHKALEKSAEALRSHQQAWQSMETETMDAIVHADGAIEAITERWSKETQNSQSAS